MNFKSYQLESLSKLKAMKKLRLFETVYLIVTGHGYNHKDSSNRAFLDGMKPVVFLGRMLCILSRDDVLKREESVWRIPYPAIISGCLSVFFLIYAILLGRANIIRFQTDKTTSEKLGEFSLPSYAWTMFFVYTYQVTCGTRRLRDIVKNILDANQKSQMRGVFPSTFPRFCYLMAVVCMICGITENVMFDVKNLKELKEEAVLSTNTTLEIYYTQTYYHWHHIIPYNPIVTVVFVILVKCGTWGWAYMDIITITLCRAIAEKFRIMRDEVGYLMDPSNTPMTIKTKIAEGRIMSLTWDTVREEFVMLTDLVHQIEKLIAPLILACYGANMYICVITMFYWIAPYSKLSFEETSYNYFAFVQFLFRVTTVTYFVADVHHVSHSIAETIHRCPNSLYSLSLERLERTLICNPVGISLFGSFMITRKFFISIVSFIFTTEIVLLQTANSARLSSNSAP